MFHAGKGIHMKKRDNAAVLSSTKIAEQKVPLNIALSPDDKQFLKLYAIKHSTNVSALITAYIKELRNTEQ